MKKRVRVPAELREKKVDQFEIDSVASVFEDSYETDFPIEIYEDDDLLIKRRKVPEILVTLFAQGIWSNNL